MTVVPMFCEIWDMYPCKTNFYALAGIVLRTEKIAKKGTPCSKSQNISTTLEHLRLSPANTRPFCAIGFALFYTIFRTCKVSSQNVSPKFFRIEVKLAN